jgi:protease I
MKNLILISIAWTFLSLTSFAQTDDEAIKATINTYFDGFTKGDSASLNRAFYAGALLRNLNVSTGRVQDSPLKTFISKMPTGGVKATGKLISYSYAGTSGIATVELQFADFKYIDLLSLLKINEQWKIVCRVYSRVELDAQLKGSAPTEAAASPAKKNSANVKPKKNDGW